MEHQSLVESTTENAEYILNEYLSECKQIILAEIRQIIPQNRYCTILYDYMLEYPLRLGKGFRPSLCIAVCRACGGRLHDILTTASALELYHNAFLIHDDIEDGSFQRRGETTLHEKYGIPIAVNVGDGMNALCMTPLLQNLEIIGLEKTIKIFRKIEKMARESVEGQAMELDWVHQGNWDLRDRDYFLMTYKKTCWYTFIIPMQLGGLVAGLSTRKLNTLQKFGTYMGIAFQIQDDILNLIADREKYGKEIGGDLWEGKHTLMVIHLMRSCIPKERLEALRIFSKYRREKNPEEIEFLYELLAKYQSIEYARSVALVLAEKANRIMNERMSWISPSNHRNFLQAMIDYVVSRDW
jgi:geranylgeranyl diphosphate synthase type II